MSAAATSSPFPAPAKVGLKYKKALGDRKEIVTKVLKEIGQAVGADTAIWDGETDVGILLAQSAADSSNTKLTEFLNGDIGSRTESLLSRWRGGVEHQCKNADVKKALADAWTTKKVQLRWTKDVEKDVEPGSTIEPKWDESIGLKDGVITLYIPLNDLDRAKHSEIYLSELLTKHSASANPGAAGLDLQQKKEYAYRGEGIEKDLKAIAKSAGLDTFTWDYETDVPAMIAFHKANPGLVNVAGGNFESNLLSNCSSIISSLEKGLTHQFNDPMIKEAFVDAVSKKQLSIKIVKDVSTDVTKDQSALTSRNNGAVQIKDGVFICYQNAKDWSNQDHRSVKIENLL